MFLNAKDCYAISIAFPDRLKNNLDKHVSKVFNKIHKNANAGKFQTRLFLAPLFIKKNDYHRICNKIGELLTKEGFIVTSIPASWRTFWRLKHLISWTHADMKKAQVDTFHGFVNQQMYKRMQQQASKLDSKVYLSSNTDKLIKGM